MTAMSESDKLPVRTKMAYGLGTIAFGIKDQGFNTLLMLYYNQVIGLPAAWVGLAIMIAMVVDAFSDPLIGHFSDQFRSRWGRRHPFMYASALPMAIGYLLLWTPPDGSHEAQFAYLLVTAVMVRVAIACYEIPSSTLMMEMTSDYNERTSISTYRALFLAIGGIGMSFIVLKYFLKATPESPVGQLGAAGYENYAVFAAIVMMLTVLLSTWGTHSRIPMLNRNLPTAHPGLGELWRGMKVLLTDRTCGSIFLCMLFFGVGTGYSTSIGVYVTTYFWNLNAEHLASIAGSTVLGLILALIVVQLSKKWGKKIVTITLYSTALLAITVPTALGLMGLMPTDISQLLPWLILKNVLVTMSVIAAIILASSMGADVGDHMHLKTGRRMEGLIFAAAVMISKAVSGLGVFASGLVLTAIGFPEKATPETVTPELAYELTFIYLIGMAALYFLAILSLSLYPITREIHEGNVRKLKEMQAHTAQPGGLIVQPQ